MNDLDVNILIQVFNEKISSLMTEIVVKDATIRQLSSQIEAAQAESTKTEVKKKEEDFK